MGPIGQAEELFQGLKLLGKRVEFVRYPGGFHTINTHAPSQIVDRMRRTIAWYDRHAPRARRPGTKARRRARAGAH